MILPDVIDPTHPQPVKYCIPSWLRDEQVRRAIARPLPRVQPATVLQTVPLAIACYGPSLNDTWEQLRGFSRIMSCSGAHRFLLDRAVVPTYHLEVDPRPHKVALLGPPHPDVEYLIASACHTDVFDHLADAHVKLWHVYDTDADGYRALPRSEWAIMGGSSVGLRALTMARFLGYTRLHIFGMDGCVGATGAHAAAHPNPPPGTKPCLYDGVTYQTTSAFAECARQTFHELDQMPDVAATFYGEGLVQHMARRWTQKTSSTAAIAHAKPDLISTEYRELNTRLHEDDLAYGVGGGRHAPKVLALVEAIGARSVLDYGCGKGYLAKALPFPIWEYDPAIPGKETSPRAAELVVCTDVLEHIEPDKLLLVLDDLRRCMTRVGYFTINTEPAWRTLHDGRNTHLIQRAESWWRARLETFFTVGSMTRVGQDLHVVVGVKGPA